MQIKNRSLLVQILLMVVTFGLYSLYWFYETSVELKLLSKEENVNPVLMLILLFIPFGVIYSHYKYSEMFEKVSGDHLNKWILYILWFLCPPAVWLIVQIELNKHAPTQTGCPACTN